jgi:hypothetical protein
MLSLDKSSGSIPIVEIIGGKYSGEVIFLDTDKKGAREIKIKDKGVIKQIPKVNTREFVYIAGPSGSGKTTKVAEYVSTYKQLFPENDIFLFSRLSEDEAIDHLDIIRIPITTKLDRVNVVNDIKDALVIFDDIDTIPDKKLRSKVYEIQNDILEIGRHNNIHIIVTSHLINGNDRKNTRTILNEAHTITIFPKAGGSYGIEYVLKNYIGLSMKQISKLLKLPSRSVTISKTFPQYVFYDKGIYLL